MPRYNEDSGGRYQGFHAAVKLVNKCGCDVPHQVRTGLGGIQQSIWPGQGKTWTRYGTIYHLHSSAYYRQATQPPGRCPSYYADCCGIYYKHNGPIYCVRVVYIRLSKHPWRILAHINALQHKASIAVRGSRLRSGSDVTSDLGPETRRIGSGEPRHQLALLRYR